MEEEGEEQEEQAPDTFHARRYANRCKRTMQGPGRTAPWLRLQASGLKKNAKRGSSRVEGGDGAELLRALLGLRLAEGSRALLRLWSQPQAR